MSSLICPSNSSDLNPTEIALAEIGRKIRLFNSGTFSGNNI